MHTVALSTLRAFWERHPDAEQALRSWYNDTRRARWRTPDDVKLAYGNASILAHNRVVFNVRGNTYRIVAAVHYNTGPMYVRFVGTHAEYDRIDAETV